jgi:hypothetical protein
LLLAHAVLGHPFALIIVPRGAVQALGRLRCGAVRAAADDTRLRGRCNGGAFGQLPTGFVRLVGEGPTSRVGTAEAAAFAPGDGGWPSR